MQTKITKEKKFTNEEIKEYIGICLSLDYRFDNHKENIINDLNSIESIFNVKLIEMEIVEEYDDYTKISSKLITKYNDGSTNYYEV